MSELTGYLVFDNEADAWARAEQEGRAVGYDFYLGTGIVKYTSEPHLTDDDKFALRINNYTALTDEEKASVVTTVNFYEHPIVEDDD